MDNFKTKDSAAFVVLGMLLGWVLGPIILAVSIPQTFSYYGSSGAGVFFFVGVVVEILGLILLIVGIGRALGTLDYLGRKASSQVGASR